MEPPYTLIRTKRYAFLAYNRLTAVYPVLVSWIARKCNNESIFQLPLPAIRTCVRLAAIQQWRWTAQRIGAICNDGSRFSTYWRRQPFLNGRPFPNGQPFLTTTDTTVAVVDASRILTFERCPRHLSPRHLRCLHQ